MNNIKYGGVFTKIRFFKERNPKFDPQSPVNKNGHQSYENLNEGPGRIAQKIQKTKSTGSCFDKIETGVHRVLKEI